MPIEKEKTRVTLEAFFPELKGGRAEVKVGGEGATTRSAINDAMRALLKHPKLKRRHYTNFKTTFYIFKPQKVKETPSEENAAEKP